MRSILWLLGVLFGFAAARALDAGWVMFWYVGGRALDLPLQAVIDAGGMAAAGLVTGFLARWLAGGTATGVGLVLALLLLLATGVDLFLGIANEPWWHELVTALVMVPGAAFGGGSRLPRRRRRVLNPEVE